MNKSEIIQAFLYPFKGERIPRRFLIGCLIGLIPIIGSLFILGYAIQGMKEIVGGDDELPRWLDPIGLFIWAVKCIAIGLVYGVAFFVPFGIGLFLILVIPHIIAVNLGFIFLILSGIFFLSVAFIVPMALIFVIHARGSFRAALRFEDILITIRDTANSYVIRSAFVWVVAFLCIGVMLLMISIPIVHYFAAIPVLYMLLVGSYVFGLEGRQTPVMAKVPIVTGIGDAKIE